MKQTVREFFKQFPDDQSCLDHLFKVQFGDDHVCPSCERPGRWYPLTNRRAYSCQWCGRHEFPCVGTPFERSRTPLQLWFFAIYMFTTTRNGVSAKELERQLGVTYKCAWRMAHEIRKHMAKIDGDDPLSGHVEMDEAYIGGRKRGGKKHGLTGRGAGKSIVFGMVQRDGDVILRAVPTAGRKSLLPAVATHVVAGSKVSTDEWPPYQSLAAMGYDHDTVDHRSKEWVSGDTHTNTIESIWAALKRGIRGTHIHVSRRHLPKYLGEFEYRYNARKRPDSMFAELVSTYPSLSEE